MTVRIAHASIDERGKITGGSAGDQTGKEVCIRSWYSKPWQYVIRCKDRPMREKIAYAMETACKNENIGYDQSQRNTLLTNARKVGYNPAKVTVKCETDCSALVALACIYAGIPETSLVMDGNSATTSTLRKRLLATGKFDTMSDRKYTSESAYLMRGDILLKEGSHVVVVLDNGTKTNTIETNPETNIQKQEIIRQEYQTMPETLKAYKVIRKNNHTKTKLRYLYFRRNHNKIPKSISHKTIWTKH